MLVAGWALDVDPRLRVVDAVHRLLVRLRVGAVHASALEQRAGSGNGDGSGCAGEEGEEDVLDLHVGGFGKE